jgi:hypothetical protein
VTFDTDTIIAKLDDGSLTPMTIPVARRLVDALPRKTPFQHALLGYLDANGHSGHADWLSRLWDEINALPLHRQGGLRLMVPLLHDDAPLDWYTAGFFIHWAKECGIPDKNIGRAFGIELPNE